jgi:hypothetical protein
MTAYRNNPHLSARANAFGGRTVRITRAINLTSMSPAFHVVRGIDVGETGTVLRVSDAGFAGLVFWVQLATGECTNVYETGCKVVKR